MRRLAFLSPLPPAATGIADYSADVLALIADRYELEVFHDQDEIERRRLPEACAFRQSRAFLGIHEKRPFDLAIYQMGNAPAHAFVYPFLARVPGLLVLHDLVLHHSRALTFLDSAEVRAYARDSSNAVLRDRARDSIARYKAEVEYSYPAQAGRLAETHLETVGTLLPYAYPMFRLPVESARITAVHNEFMAQAIRAEIPEALVLTIPMAAEPIPAKADDVAALRARYGIEKEDFVVGGFGLLTPEKRIETLARAVARAAVHLPHLRLLLVGTAPDAADLKCLIEKLGVGKRAVITGHVPFGDLPTHMEAADLVVQLRYPTARETSAALLRVLSQGRPTVISDLEHQNEIPLETVIRADVTDEEGEVTRAILRLAHRPDLRQRLGDRARRFVQERHSPARCLAAYENAIEQAIVAPNPEPRMWPEHWLGRSERRA
ncbi:MAG: glycosyltransferase family 4 protein [Vicinamibacteria bacterium]|nr:glycosyltransferase family 4 protein [Vicinamibacteria bacterium]